MNITLPEESEKLTGRSDHKLCKLRKIAGWHGYPRPGSRPYGGTPLGQKGEIQKKFGRVPLPLSSPPSFFNVYIIQSERVCNLTIIFYPSNQNLSYSNSIIITMPTPSIDLEPYKAEIIDLFQTHIISQFLLWQNIYLIAMV
jgi:hypothetical protein